MISPVTSYSEVQEESHSRVQNPPQQKPDSGIEKYGPWFMKITTISRAQRTRGAGRWRMIGLGGWMDGWINGWMDEWLDGWMDGWRGGRLDGWIDGWLDGWMDG